MGGLPPAQRHRLRLRSALGAAKSYFTKEVDTPHLGGIKPPMKHCNGCGLEFVDVENNFYRSLHKSSGFMSKCKTCCRERDRKRAPAKNARRRIRRLTEEFKHKQKARLAARAKYKSPRLYDCAVLDCSKKAQDLHHVSYTDVYSVIPLCRKHHAANHFVCSVESELAAKDHQSSTTVPHKQKDLGLS